ncbi:MAG: carboxypeptidase-like regulatory domain-containing protein [Bacteroidales bacterium]
MFSYRKSFLTIVIIILNYSYLFSQTITGVVLNDKKEPIIGASVYFDGTALGTITNANGEFTLSLKSRINTSLVISCLGYETYTSQSFFNTPYLKVELTAKPYQIKEVVVKKDRFTRKQKMKIFKEYFLGATKAGRSCLIQNEDDISLYYNEKNNTLFASSEKPLIIINNHLGYTITANLIEFNVIFNKTSIRSEYVRSSLFLVTTYFADNHQNSLKYKKRRNKSYLGSSLHFFRNLSNNTWNKNDFLLFNGSFPAIPSQFFSVSDTIDLKKVSVEKNVTVSTNIYKAKVPFVSTFNILYKNRRQSKVIFRTNVFFVDKYGINTSPELIQFGGDMGKQRLGDLLPFEYSIDI